jgi:hypothetical protein
VEQRIADVQSQLAQLKPMQDIYANSYALRTLYWHVANLEFANATALDKLSLRFWDQDDHYRFDGAHVIRKSVLFELFSNSNAIDYRSLSFTYYAT